MRKLRLDPESLTVDRFEPVAESMEEKGTVRGNQQSNRFTFCWTQPEHGSTCVPAYTCPECAYTIDPCAEETLVC